jgi:uncharacterized protein YqgQ
MKLWFKGILIKKGDICNFKEVLMATPLDPKQIVSYEELLMSQVVQQEALTRLLVEKGIFSKDEFLEMVRVVNQEMNKGRKREL